MNIKVLNRFDLLTILLTAGIVTIGLLAVYSATYSNGLDLFYKQFYFAIFGFIIMISVSYIPPKHINKISVLMYFVAIVLLVLVLFVGKRIGGNRSWFSFAGFGIQPSEFAKVATILMLSRFLTQEDKEVTLKSPLDFIKALAIVFLPIALIMRQPDMGTSLVFFSLILPMFLWAGMSFYTFVVILLPMIVAGVSFFTHDYFYFALGASVVILLLFRKKLYMTIIFSVMNAVAGFSVNFLYSKLALHQQNRIMAVINPSSDPLGTGYNVIQSKVAIGSGGLWGKGLLHGTQTQLKFIPEQWTDFIFCVIGEEMGFIVSTILILLFLVLVIRLINNAASSKNRFLSLATIGFSTILTFHLIINVGMTIGIMPVIGIPLPMVSYGVSSMLSFLFMLGLNMNNYRNRNIPG